MRDEIMNSDVDSVVILTKDTAEEIVQSKNFTSFDFRKYDFRFQNFTNCEFKDCDFSGVKIINNHFKDCRFIDCIFDETSFGSEVVYAENNVTYFYMFENCLFQDNSMEFVKFSNLIMLHCLFQENYMPGSQFEKVLIKYGSKFEKNTLCDTIEFEPEFDEDGDEIRLTWYEQERIDNENESLRSVFKEVIFDADCILNVNDFGMVYYHDFENMFGNVRFEDYIDDCIIESLKVK